MTPITLYLFKLLMGTLLQSPVYYRLPSLFWGKRDPEKMYVNRITYSGIMTYLGEADSGLGNGATAPTRTVV